MLAEYHISERIASDYSQNYDSTKIAFFSYYYPELLSKHNITKEGFEASFYYYSAQPEKFKTIYKDVEEIIQEKRDYWLFTSTNF